MRPHSGGYTAAEREQALKEAEERLVRPGLEDAREVLLRLDQIITHPVLFQPRAFLSARVDASGEINDDHVKKLQRRIAISGELDPITVLQIREFDWSGDDGKLWRPKWVVVDGHHRLEAYRARKWEAPLRCVWFAGSAKEAMDLAGQTNSTLHLTMHRNDREEEVWKRVLMNLSPGSKLKWTREQLRKQFHVSTATITLMRKVARWHGNKSDRTKSRREFRALYPDIRKCSWFSARLFYWGASKKERTEEEQAQTFARIMRERFEKNSKYSLSRDPEITAAALAIYDPKLPRQLTAAWKEEPSEAVAAFRSAEARADLEEAGEALSGGAKGNGGGTCGDLEDLDDPEDAAGLGAIETPSVGEGAPFVQNGGCSRYQISPSACERTSFAVLDGGVGDGI